MVGSFAMRDGVRLRAFTLLLGGIVLAGQGAAALAQESAGPFDGLLEKLQVKGQAVPAAPFVQQGRPAGEKTYIPVGTAHKERPLKVMTPAEVAAAEADLDAARERQQRRAGHKPAVVPLKPGKAPAAGQQTNR